MAFAYTTMLLPIWAQNPFLSTEFLITIGLLIGTLLTGAVVLYFTDIWRKKQLTDGPQALESLTHYRELYDRGEITETEYQAIRSKVASRVKKEGFMGKAALPETTLPLADDQPEPSTPDAPPPSSDSPPKS